MNYVSLSICRKPIRKETTLQSAARWQDILSFVDTFSVNLNVNLNIGEMCFTYS